MGIRSTKHLSLLDTHCCQKYQAAKLAAERVAVTRDLDHRLKKVRKTTGRGWHDGGGAEYAPEAHLVKKYVYRISRYMVLRLKEERHSNLAPQATLFSQVLSVRQTLLYYLNNVPLNAIVNGVSTTFTSPPEPWLRRPVPGNIALDKATDWVYGSR